MNNGRLALASRTRRVEEGRI